MSPSAAGSSRALYASAIQHVLVLQEEEVPEDNVDEEYRQRKFVSSSGKPRPTPTVYPWRVDKRARTANGVLAFCLNIGVDPPYSSRTRLVAKLQCWIEPTASNAAKSVNMIATALKGQYEQWQGKAKYKLCADPTIAELKKACLSIRRGAKDDLVLFHYNGHGVPKPTRNGEFWVFNGNYTQYVPMNMHDLRDAIGDPTLMVFDCNAAGRMLPFFENYHATHAQNERANQPQLHLPNDPLRHGSVFLGACGKDELLPTNANLPADLFTSCLTTPLKMLMKWFFKQSLVTGITMDMLDKVPGHMNRRETPLGELHWIYTSITDAIAWNILPRDVFKKLYRQHMLLASMMRNFLLAQRIMFHYGCRPVSEPSLPDAHDHPLWHSLDLVLEELMWQLPRLIANEEERMKNHSRSPSLGQKLALGKSSSPSMTTIASSSSRKPPKGKLAGDGDEIEGNERKSGHHGGVGSIYVPSTFFVDQMKAFDIWLNMGPKNRGPPEHLPILLQAIVSLQHQKTAMPLFSRYMQTGPVAVDHVLSVGAFPHMITLLQTQSPEMKKELVFIWSKILALDETCSADLVKESGELLFVNFLNYPNDCNNGVKPVYLACAMFSLSVIAKLYADRCVEVGTMEACYKHLTHEDQFVRRWACLCLSVVIRHVSPPTHSEILRKDFVPVLRNCAKHDVAPDVRAAALSALSALMGEILSRLNGNSDYSRTSVNDYQPSPHIKELNFNTRSSNPSNQERSERQPKLSIPARIGGFPDHLAGFRFGAIQLTNSPVLSYSRDERDVLITIGSDMATIGRMESSVLVRREVAIAVARAMRCCPVRFTRAAICTDIIGSENWAGLAPGSEAEACENVYRRMWTTVSELAFDPHPIIAALARRTYDVISEALPAKLPPPGTLSLGGDTGKAREFVGNMGKRNLVSPVNKTSAPAESILSERRIDIIGHEDVDSSYVPKDFNTVEPHFSPFNKNSDPKWKSFVPEVSGREDEPLALLSNSDVTLARSLSSTISPNPNTKASEHGKPPVGMAQSPNLVSMYEPSQNLSTQVLRKEKVHVSSTSGSFELTVSSRLPYIGRIPRVSSSNFNPQNKESNSLHPQPLSLDNAKPNTSIDSIQEENTGGRSLLRVTLTKGDGKGLKGPNANLSSRANHNTSLSQANSYGSSSSIESGNINATSPPRPPRRSLSFQVLNAASTFSHGGEIPISASSRPTYFASKQMVASNDDRNKSFKLIPPGYDGLYLSGHGDAALSLYEWSSAYIALVQFDTEKTDSIMEEELVPRYAALWDKFLKESGSIPFESLRAFAVLGEGQNGMGIGGIVDEEGRKVKFSEISSNAMGAGGGAVTAMSFLPRDVGIGDDQLIATGDSTGSVGVYDIKTGTCKAAFGIPFPPGIPEVGVSSLLCLNRPSCATDDYSFSLGNSRSALLLGGAFDGRVAVFKSDLQGPKYRIMSTFQASGQSYWSKVGTSREPGHRPSQHDVMPGTENTNMDDGSLSFASTVKKSGNGLVLAFDPATSYLVAGGCDNEIVRLWDLSTEKCLWEGAAVARGTYPTAVTMWGRLNPRVFVVGASDGQIFVVDSRNRARSVTSSGSLVGITRQVEPIISLGTCPPVGGHPGDVLVSADIGGDVLFWDARWNESSGILRRPESLDVSKIRAHKTNLTSMAVHPLGTLVATGSTARCVKVFGPNRSMIKMMNAHDAGSGANGGSGRIPPVSSLAFQPESNMLAVGAVDNSVMIFGQPDSFPGVRADVDLVTEAKNVALREYWRAE